MKLLCSISCLLFLTVFNKPQAPGFSLTNNYTDTGHIVHIVDGQVTEWPAGKFQPNEDSTVEYAVDNDDKNLYLVMSIPDFGEQMKIMKNGMKLFIDLKGKKKEGKGIEFPVKGEVSSQSPSAANANPGNDQPQKLDRKTQRNLLALDIVALKLFGFADAQDEQGLTMPGSVNIAFKWDESDIMHIEYKIPFSLLSESSSLDQKDISIGWKINGFERPQGDHRPQNAEGNGGGSSRGMHGGGGGRGQYGGGGRGFGGRSGMTSYRKIDPDEMRKEQNFWTKYLVTIQPSQKAF